VDRRLAGKLVKNSESQALLLEIGAQLLLTSLGTSILKRAPGVCDAGVPQTLLWEALLYTFCSRHTRSKLAHLCSLAIEYLAHGKA
jgi:hypothetical protein